MAILGTGDTHGDLTRLLVGEKFEMDYDIQWEKSFQSVIQRFYDVIDWGEINLVNNKLNKFFI